MAPIDLISILVSDELACRSKRLLERRHKQAQFRDPNKLLDNFDFQFNPKMNRGLVFDLATAAWIGRREDALFLGPADPGSYCPTSLCSCEQALVLFGIKYRGSALPRTYPLLQGLCRFSFQ